jgi:hypothetical protein
MGDDGNLLPDSFKLTGQGKLRQQYIARRKSVFLFQGQSATTAIHRDYTFVSAVYSVGIKEKYTE